MNTAIKGNIYLTWTLRILLMIMIVLFALFSMDVFEGEQGFWDTTVAFLMHNIPSFVMIIILIIAWKREDIGRTFNVISDWLCYIPIHANEQLYVWNPDHARDPIFNRCTVCCELLFIG